MYLIKLLQNHFQTLLKNPLIVGSLVMFIGTNIHNVGQLAYHFLAINLLSKAHYGDLAAMVSIFGFIAIIQQSLGLAVVKFIASAKSEKDADNLARWVFYWGMWIAFAIFILILLLAPIISRFLRISDLLAVYMFAPIVFIGFISNNGRALLQGFIKFSHLSGSMIVEVTLKIILTILFLYFGYELTGATVALFLGLVVGLMVVWTALKSKLKGPIEVIPEMKGMFVYSLPVLVQSIATTSMMSTDMLLVKHYFHPDVAGAYAALAKFGTIALFAASPIAQVMFPLIARKQANKSPYRKIFYLSLFLILMISSVVVMVYYFFSELIAGFLTSGKYVAEAYLLWWLGLYMLLLGVAILFTQFYLSVGRTAIVWLFGAAAVLQILLIMSFHSTLLVVVQVSIFLVALLVGALSIYFPYYDKE